MGACLGKFPASRDEIRHEIRLLRDENRVHTYEIMTILHRMDGRLRMVSDDTTCPTGKMRAKYSTVSINGGLGHGFLIRQYNTFYVLTAAHVAVAFTKDDDVDIKMYPWTSECLSFTRKVEKTFITADYVKKGIVDIGLIQVHMTSSDLKTLGLQWYNLQIDSTPYADGLVVGEGQKNFHIQGHRVQALSNENSRLVIHAPSINGMSGLPLFQANGKLVCLNHGDSKHRGGHKAGNPGCPSPYLYADSFARGLKIICIDENYSEALKDAEEMSSELAEQSHLQHFDAPTESYKKFVEKLGGRLNLERKVIMSSSIDKMMLCLAEKCFVMNETVELFDWILVASCGDDEKLVDEWSQGHQSTTKKPETPSPVQRQRNQQSAGEEP